MKQSFKCYVLYANTQQCYFLTLSGVYLHRYFLNRFIYSSAGDNNIWSSRKVHATDRCPKFHQVQDDWMIIWFTYVATR